MKCYRKYVSLVGFEHLKPYFSAVVSVYFGKLYHDHSQVDTIYTLENIIFSKSMATKTPIDAFNESSSRKSAALNYLSSAGVLLNVITLCNFSEQYETNFGMMNF